MNSLLGYDPKYDGFDPKFPSPPRIHWLVLAVAWLGIVRCINQYAPATWRGIAHSLVIDAWVFYLCNWIRQLDPESKSPFWCDVYVVVELACAGLGSIRHLSSTLYGVVELLAVTSTILWIATIFLIRNDLERHYNDREHAGLALNGLMTFFFSFIYFQYHLYDIAKRKKRATEALTSGAYESRTS